MSISFIDAFIEIYNVNSAVTIIFFFGLNVLSTHKLDKNLLKARLFLKDSIIQRTWKYISIGVIFLAINALITFAIKFTTFGDILSNYYAVELTEIIFLTAFILAVCNWNIFINNNLQR
ncbi:MAG: hypothetical protein KKA10_02825 [Euryarchaeota archaeon]|nr:hypothetical protein [Euryarchaeota archaeon]MCG2734947.1 hypothetical protein [Candidatus Methanoperedenaceae archaeon]